MAKIGHQPKIESVDEQIGECGITPSGSLLTLKKKAAGPVSCTSTDGHVWGLKRSGSEAHTVLVIGAGVEVEGCGIVTKNFS